MVSDGCGWYRYIEQIFCVLGHAHFHVLVSSIVTGGSQSLHIYIYIIYMLYILYIYILLYISKITKLIFRNKIFLKLFNFFQCKYQFK